MERAGEGWWSLDTDAVAPGETYAFRLDDSDEVPDPAARALDAGVHKPARLVDPAAFDWRADWSGRPWSEAVVYELHVGAFTPEGDFDAAAARLPHLADLGDHLRRADAGGELRRRARLGL
jgi:maltooligosyltrehalose trehalohydrolase